MASGSIIIHHSHPDIWAKLKAQYDGSPYEVAVGIPRGGKSIGTCYPDGTPVLAVAVWNEYGTEGKHPIPARPFIKEGGRVASSKLRPLVRKIMQKSNTRHDFKKAMGQVGEKAAAIMKRVVRDWSEPANAPMTIAKKGYDDPLHDTGLLGNSITYQVRLKSKRRR